MLPACQNYVPQMDTKLEKQSGKENKITLYAIREFGWPRMQTALSLNHWQIWRKFLTKWCSNATLKVSHPFGPWILKEITNWNWCYCEIESRLYKKKDYYGEPTARHLDVATDYPLTHS